MRASQPQDWNSFSIISALALSWGVPTLLAPEAISLFQSLWRWAESKASNFCSSAACCEAPASEKPTIAGGLSPAARALRERLPARAVPNTARNFADHGRRMGDLAMQIGE